MDKYSFARMMVRTRAVWPGSEELQGLTVTVLLDGFITKSISSIGTAPIKTESPIANAPVKENNL